MMVRLPEHVERSINAVVQSGHFASIDDAMTEAANLLLQKLDIPVENAPSLVSEVDNLSRRKPIWERIIERSAAIPEEEWDKLPTDLAEQHDHYLYGTRKRSTP
jgi:Arc/MetJ-type ribon-helix-helix transcriptional regulator